LRENPSRGNSGTAVRIGRGDESSRKVAAFVAICSCLLLTACAPHQFRPNYNLPLACTSKIVMIRCDPQTAPVQCEKIAVTYKPGCEELVAGR